MSIRGFGFFVAALIGLSALVPVVHSANASQAVVAQVPPTPPPPPPPLPGPTRGGVSVPISPAKTLPPSAPPTPAESATPAFASLDGTWEVQLQRGAETTYSHLFLKQEASGLSGTWKREDGEIPFTGSFDGRVFRIVTSAKTGPQYTLSGYVENATDMVGLVDSGKESIAFTASHHGGYKPLAKKAPKPKKT